MPLASEMRSRMARPAKRHGHTHYIDSRQRCVYSTHTDEAAKFHVKMRMYRNNK